LEDKNINGSESKTIHWSRLDALLGSFHSVNRFLNRHRLAMVRNETALFRFGHSQIVFRTLDTDLCPNLDHAFLQAIKFSRPRRSKPLVSGDRPPINANSATG